MIIQENDYFTLNPALGYSKKQCSQAMQVMELWPDVMTVACAGGCMTKPYRHFKKVSDLSECTEIYSSRTFENNRNHGPLGM